MAGSNNNLISDKNESIGFLAKIANEMDGAFTNNPQLKSSMIKHIKKVIQKAEEYGRYLRTEWQKAKKARLTQYDENKDKERWFWWTAWTEDMVGGEKGVYFTNDELMRVQFYIKGKPKPDPLRYLSSMIWGSVGEIYEGLELLDYQCVLLAIIHDAQSWQAGRERIYFNRLEEKTLSDRLCKAVWNHLEDKIDSYEFRDVKRTIETALQKIKADIGQAVRNSGDTYHIIGEHISLGDKAQHAGRDINTSEPEKEKGGWGRIKKISLILGIILTILLIIWTSIQIRNHHYKEDTSETPPKQIETPKTEAKDEEEKISIGDVNGDVVISQNQSGGITAHTVSFNQSGGITAGKVVINNTIQSVTPVLKAKLLCVSKPAGDFFLTQAELSSEQVIPNLYLAAYAHTIQDFNVTPMRTGMALYGHSGKRDDHHFTNISNFGGKYLLTIRTSQREDVKVEYDY